jgi:hypothetical protein
MIFTDLLLVLLHFNCSSHRYPVPFVWNLKEEKDYV